MSISRINQNSFLYSVISLFLTFKYARVYSHIFNKSPILLPNSPLTIKTFTGSF